MASIERKSFHCIGGSIYAYYPGVDRDLTIRLIVALQTISDYLDNLCDRLHVLDGEAFTLLHQAFFTAVSPGMELQNYYGAYPHWENEYLPSLVKTCQNILVQIPFYEQRKASVQQLADYYCKLQVLKHLPNGEHLLQDWTKQTFTSHLRWNEWAASTGSTLGIFFLFAISYQPQTGHEIKTFNVYFPWVQGLHILLDYLIDQEEDLLYGDLNFISSFSTNQDRDLSLLNFATKSRDLVVELPNAYFHKTVLSGLIALYGSDPKVRKQNLQTVIMQLGPERGTRLMIHLCRALRKINVIPN